MPFALLLQKGVVEPVDLNLDVSFCQSEHPAPEYVSARAVTMKRAEAIESLQQKIGADDLIVSTTGKISRELFEIEDRAGNFYMQGSMGHAASIGLGLSLNQSKPVVVLDGDGAVLMKMGTLATVGNLQPERFLHIILDNGCYDTTGAQLSVSSTLSFADIALACNYKRAASVCTEHEMIEYIDLFKKEKGPSLIHMKVLKGADKNLGRPTLSPVEIRERFMRFIGE